MNLGEVGVGSSIASFNSKPLLLRQTGSVHHGRGYMEQDMHVHKFANVAKQSILMLTSRCGVMYMQIGFVIEGREDAELLGDQQTPEQFDGIAFRREIAILVEYCGI